jgi:ABC-2 type transport system permease protein
MNPTFLRYEVLRLVRNRRIVIFSVILPSLIFELSAQGSPKDRLGGFTVVTYVLVSMLTYSSLLALLSGGARISLERSVGWNRQLRIAGLSGRTYITTKVALSYASAVPGAIVLLLFGASQDARFGGVRWVEVPLSIMVCLAPVAALGVLAGYLAKPDALQQIIGLGSALLAFAGGLFIPAANFSHTVLEVVKLLPPYWAAEVGRDVLQDHWLPAQGTVVVVAWTVALGAVAARIYARDSAK